MQTKYTPQPHPLQHFLKRVCLQRTKPAPDRQRHAGQLHELSVAIAA